MEVSEFTNYPKVTGNASNLAYCCGGTKFNLFWNLSLPLIEKPFSKYVFIMLPVFYQRNLKKKFRTSFCAAQKINILKTFPGQAWCSAVTDTSYSSVLNPKQSWINQNLLNLYMTRFILLIVTIVFDSQHDLKTFFCSRNKLEISLIMCK